MESLSEILVELPPGGDWKIFDGQRFRNIWKKRINCSTDTLLMHCVPGKTTFYKVRPKGLVRISKREATRIILSMVDLEELYSFRVLGFSRGKFVFRVLQWDDSEAFSFSLSGDARITRKLLERERTKGKSGQLGFSRGSWNGWEETPEAGRRSYSLLMEVVSKSDRLWLVRNTVKVKSRNGRTYSVCLETANVVRDDGKRCCVWVDGYSLPLYDRVLAKALAIAYKPELISTL